ncbi:hypothetical protein FACS1894187_06890 [Synergistales bacterium]|nr:hypothetical protein FACS1894187_06890 [Synergistales bacterium]
MAWIKSHSELMTHPKVKRAARALGISVVTMIGHLHALWWWAMEYTPDGLISAYDLDDIAEAAAWEQDPKIFIDALINCGAKDCPGLVDMTENGDLFIHDWEEHCGKEYEKRIKDAERLRAYRTQQKEKRTQSVQRTNDVRNEDEQCTYSVEREREIEKEIHTQDKDPVCVGEAAQAALPPNPQDCPHGEIVSLYHEILPELQRVKDWTADRQAFLRARWRSSPERQSLDWWREYFLSVRNMDWLMGRREGRDGRPFYATLEWLVRPQNFNKIIEGFYLDRGSKTGPPGTHSTKQLEDIPTSYEEAVAMSERKKQGDFIDAEFHSLGGDVT